MTTSQYPALGFDPAPGDTAGIGDLAEKYRVVGQDLEEANTCLRQIVTKQGIWTGEASEAFARRLGPLPEYLDGAARSMTQAAGALDSWTHDLGEMQRRAQELEQRAKAAAQAAEQARNNPDFALANRTFTDQQSLQIAQNLLDNAGRALEEAVNGCVEIQEAAKKLLEQHTEVANRVADLLRKAKELAPDEPSVLDDIVGAVTGAVTDLVNLSADMLDAAWDFVQDHAEVFSKVSDVLGDIGTAIGVLGDLPLPPPVDQIVGAVSAGFGLAALGGHLTAKAAGADVAPETLAFDSLGAVASIVGMIPGVPGTPIKVLGYGLLAEQVVGEAIGGDSFESPIDDFLNYWVPKDAGQAAMVAGSIFTAGVPFHWAAVAVTNAAEAGVAADNAPARQRERKEDKTWS